MSLASGPPSFDVLTGLLDRASFIRELARRAANGEIGASGCVLAILDIVELPRDQLRGGAHGRR